MPSKYTKQQQEELQKKVIKIPTSTKQKSHEKQWYVKVKETTQKRSHEWIKPKNEELIRSRTLFQTTPPFLTWFHSILLHSTPYPCTSIRRLSKFRILNPTRPNPNIPPRHIVIRKKEAAKKTNHYLDANKMLIFHMPTNRSRATEQARAGQGTTEHRPKEILQK